MTYSPPEAYATEKQTAFIKSLLEQRTVATEVKEYVEGQISVGTMTKQEASKRIEWLLAQPKAEKPKTTYIDPPEGMHKVEDKIFKVYRTRSGHIVASELREIGGAWGFEYQGKRGLKGLSEATRMPAEEAKAFGKTYGICVRCAAQLTDERSIFAGYGPVCAKNEGWYYPSMDEAMAGLGLTSAPDTDLSEPEATPAPIPDEEPEPWYEAATVEEAMAKLDETEIPEIGGLIVMPDDGDILTPEERAEYEARWKRGDYEGTTVELPPAPTTEGPLRMELLPEDL